MDKQIETVEDLAAMELHEIRLISQDDYTMVKVMRVFNGWVYTTTEFTCSDGAVGVTSVFVPKGIGS